MEFNYGDVRTYTPGSQGSLPISPEMLL